MRPARYHDRLGAAQHQAHRGPVEAVLRIVVMRHHHRRPARPQEHRDVGQHMGMVDVDDVGPLPGGRQVTRRDFLRAQRTQGIGAGDRAHRATRLASAEYRLHGDYLHVVTERRGTLREALHDPLHPPGARPVVLGEVQDAHACPFTKEATVLLHARRSPCRGGGKLAKLLSPVNRALGKVRRTCRLRHAVLARPHTVSGSSNRNSCALSSYQRTRSIHPSAASSAH